MQHHGLSGNAMPTSGLPGAPGIPNSGVSVNNWGLPSHGLPGFGGDNHVTMTPVFNYHPNAPLINQYPSSTNTSASPQGPSIASQAPGQGYLGSDPLQHGGIGQPPQSYLGGTQGQGQGQYQHGNQGYGQQNFGWPQGQTPTPDMILNHLYGAAQHSGGWWGDPSLGQNQGQAQGQGMFGYQGHDPHLAFTQTPNMAPTQSPYGFSAGTRAEPIGMQPQSSINRAPTQPYSFLGVNTSA